MDLLKSAPMRGSETFHFLTYMSRVETTSGKTASLSRHSIGFKCKHSFSIPHKHG